MFKKISAIDDPQARRRDGVGETGYAVLDTPAGKARIDDPKDDPHDPGGGNVGFAIVDMTRS